MKTRTRIVEHQRAEMRPAEWALLDVLLRQADDYALWQSGQPDGEPLSTEATRVLVTLARVGAYYPDNPHGPTIPPVMALELALQLEEGATLAGRAVAGDMRPSALQLFTEAEWDALDTSYRAWNGNPEEHLPGRPCMLAAGWMSYYAHKLEHLYGGRE